LLISQFIQMTCAFLLATLCFFNVVQVWHILCLSFTVGVAQAFGGPAYQALIPSLVGPEDLTNAIALNSIQFNLARVIGPNAGRNCFDQSGRNLVFRFERSIVPGRGYFSAHDSRRLRAPEISRADSDQHEAGHRIYPAEQWNGSFDRAGVLHDAARNPRC
jgi:hypothetical protein